MGIRLSWENVFIHIITMFAYLLLMHTISFLLPHSRHSPRSSTGPPQDSEISKFKNRTESLYTHCTSQNSFPFNSLGKTSESQSIMLTSDTSFYVDLFSHQKVHHHMPWQLHDYIRVVENPFDCHQKSFNKLREGSGI